MKTMVQHPARLRHRRRYLLQQGGSFKESGKSAIQDVLRLIIHIMFIQALPNKSRLPKYSSVCPIIHFANGERLGKRQILERLNAQRV